MATAAVTYTFANGTNADGTQVNSNFASVVNFLNTETIQRDASIAFTAIPSLPAVDPTTDNQVVRKAYVDNITPAGVITQYGGATAPTGWLLCQGQAISRVNALYTRLFTAIGTNYGIGDGSTTFNVPNLQGRIPVGRDSTQSEFDALAETGGSKTSTLSTANLPSHQHGVGTIVPNTIADHLHGVGTILANNSVAHNHGVGTIVPNTSANHTHLSGNTWSFKCFGNIYFFNFCSCMRRPDKKCITLSVQSNVCCVSSFSCYKFFIFCSFYFGSYHAACHYFLLMNFLQLL